MTAGWCFCCLRFFFEGSLESVRKKDLLVVLFQLYLLGEDFVGFPHA